MLDGYKLGKKNTFLQPNYMEKSPETNKLRPNMKSFIIRLVSKLTDMMVVKKSSYTESNYLINARLNRERVTNFFNILYRLITKITVEPRYSRHRRDYFVRISRAFAVATALE